MPNLNYMNEYNEDDGGIPVHGSIHDHKDMQNYPPSNQHRGQFPDGDGAVNDGYRHPDYDYNPHKGNHNVRAKKPNVEEWDTFGDVDAKAVDHAKKLRAVLNFDFDKMENFQQSDLVESLMQPVAGGNQTPAATNQLRAAGPFSGLSGGSNTYPGIGSLAQPPQTSVATSGGVLNYANNTGESRVWGNMTKDGGMTHATNGWFEPTAAQYSKGKNSRMGALMLFMMYLDPNVWTGPNGILPYQKTNDLDISFHQIIFHSALLSPLAELAPAKMLPFHEISGHGTTTRYGAAWRMSVDQLATPQGRKLFYGHLRQIMISIHETDAFNVINAVLSANNINLLLEQQYTGYPARVAQQKAADDEVHNFAILDRNGGLEEAISSIDIVMKQNNGAANTVLISERSAHHLIFSQPNTRQDVSYAGEAMGISARKDNIASVQSFINDRVVLVRSFNSGGQIINPLEREAEIGDFALMDNPTKGYVPDNYSNLTTSVEIYDYDARRNKIITELDALENCGVFNADGRPIVANIGKGFSGLKNGGKLWDQNGVPRTFHDHLGRPWLTLGLQMYAAARNSGLAAVLGKTYTAATTAALVAAPVTTGTTAPPAAPALEAPVPYTTPAATSPEQQWAAWVAHVTKDADVTGVASYTAVQNWVSDNVLTGAGTSMATIRDAGFTKANLIKMSNNKMMLPVSFILARPHHRLLTDAMVRVLGNGGCGNTFISDAIVQVGENPETNELGGQVIYRSVPLVLMPNNACTLPAAHIVSDLGGGGTKWIRFNDKADAKYHPNKRRYGTTDPFVIDRKNGFTESGRPAMFAFMDSFAFVNGYDTPKRLNLFGQTTRANAVGYGASALKGTENGEESFPSLSWYNYFLRFRDVITPNPDPYSPKSASLRGSNGVMLRMSTNRWNGSSYGAEGFAVKSDDHFGNVLLKDINPELRRGRVARRMELST